jgi:hypothetical protein
MEPDSQEITCFIIASPEANSQSLLTKFFPQGPSSSPNPTLSWNYSNTDFHVTIQHLPPTHIHQHIEEIS